MNMTTVPSNQLKAMQHEIASLKEQVAHIKEIEFPAKCIAIANIWKNKVTLLDETIAQQAEAIRVAAEQIRRCDYTPARSTLLNASSPEILQARDKRVAEACAKLVNRFISGDGILNDTWVHEIEDEILSGEWRKYL